MFLLGEGNLIQVLFIMLDGGIKLQGEVGKEHVIF